MEHDAAKIYEVLCGRIEHLEKTLFGTILALVTLTGFVLKKDFIIVNSNTELMVLYLPFAAIACLSYGLAYRVVTIVKDLAAVETRATELKKYPICYFSGASNLRKITYMIFNAQVATPFLFVPVVGNTTFHFAVKLIVVISLIIIGFFAILLWHSLFVALPVDSTHCNVKEPNNSLSAERKNSAR